MESRIFQGNFLKTLSGDEYRDEAVQVVSETHQYKDLFSVPMRTRRFLSLCSIQFWISRFGNVILLVRVFWAMNERKQIDVLKCVYNVHLYVHSGRYPPLCVKYTYS